jgi:hypothetical protein
MVNGAAAQEAPESPEPITLTVRAGFGGRIKQEKWAPVRCIIENRSGQPLQGTLSIELPAGDDQKQTYYAPIDFPSPSRRQVTLYVRPQHYVTSIDVQLKAGDLTLTQTAPTMTLLGGNPLALVLSKRPVGLFGLVMHEEFGGLQAVDGQVADLPDKAAGYEPVDVIFYNGLSLRNIRSEQEQALRRWLLDGGTLVVATGRYWRFVKDSALEPLLPVELQGAAEVDIPPHLEGNARPRRGRARISVLPLSGPTVLARVRLRDDAEVLSAFDPDQPLMAARDIGNGSVIYLACDLSLPALLYSAGQKQFYQDLLQWAGVFADEQVRRNYAPPLALGRNAARQRAVYQTAVAQAPSLVWVIVFLGVYVLAIGPLDYFVLRRLRRRHLTIITFPVLVLAFTGVAYYSAWSFKGRRVFVNEINVLHQRGDSSHVRTHFGVYSPRKATYTITLDDPTATLLPLEEPSPTTGGARGTTRPGGGRPRGGPYGGARYTMSRGVVVLDEYSDDMVQEASVLSAAFQLAQTRDAFRLPGMSVDMWAMRSFYADWWLDAGAVTADLRYEDGNIVGEITNNTRFDLEHCLLVHCNVGLPLGDLSVGQTATVRAAVAPNGRPPFHPETDLVGGTDAEAREARLALLSSLGLRPWNVRKPDTPGAGRERTQVEDILRSAVLTGSIPQPSSEALRSPMFLGWTSEPLLPIDVEGHRPGRRAVNLWLMQPDVQGLPATPGPIFSDVRPPRRVRSSRSR